MLLQKHSHKGTDNNLSERERERVLKKEEVEKCTTLRTVLLSE